ncbi:hypothetical protein PRZ48_013793 [Zasmidium cellare]|uniref:Uncharacterized protein n=1 Tax=Zasmidium cellare TaxID=395010 RepID=A0ABR0E216_ZASCE|nr:hypothetical protein PRZ48_013793 [Zasmidium cellare]
MTLKRRRERDRPKNGPEASYDPNKRVLLSYASDEDEENVEDVSQHRDPTTQDDQDFTNYQIDEYPEDEENVTVGAERPIETGEEAKTPEDQQYTHKKVESSRQAQHGKASTKWGANVRRNEKTNQYPQLGLVSFSWDEEDQDEDYDSTTEEAMAYLRAVRSERQSLPEILTAPTHDQAPEANEPWPDDKGNDSTKKDESHDDAVVAPALPPVPKEDDRAPQKVYTRSITQRFLDQRRQLRLPPTAKALADLDDSYPISFPQGNNKAFAEWLRLLSSKAPRIAQLQSLEQETVFDLLELLQSRVLTPGKAIETHVSNWIWSLLARLDDVGNMTNDQVYPLRELGKRAVFLQYSITSPEIAAQLESLGQSGSKMLNEDDVPSDDVEHIDEASKQPDSKALKNDQATATADPKAMDNTLATLDMILVVVGEVYGQRDLLEFRTPWEANQA